MIVSGWVDWASRHYGPPNKIYTQQNSGAGMVFHSMEGTYSGSMSVLDSTRPSSWMFSCRLNGELVQHYDVMSSPWASGNATANCSLWSVESEGYAGTPVNEAQVATLARLVREWEGHTGRAAVRQATLWEHREVWDWTSPNAGPTSCPSGRYAPLYAALEGGDMALIDEVIQALGGIEAIRQWNGPAAAPTGNSLLVGYGLEQQKLRQVEAQLRTHTANHPGALTGVPEHTHQPGAVTREGQR